LASRAEFSIEDSESLAQDTEFMKSNSAQMAHAAYRLAALDPDFILGDSTRGVRFMLEYQKTEDALRAAGILSTIVVFGSARLKDSDPAPKGLWYHAARDFARLASEKGGALRKGKTRHNVITTGGGPGIMEAANRGAAEAGAPSIGFNITLPHEQEPNAWSTPELTFRFHYFAMRKMHLAMRAAGLVVFPGGFGTCDELFEILTLRQTLKLPALPIVLAGSDFWKDVIRFERFADHGMIKRSDLDLFSYADKPEDIWQALIKGGLKVA
jgi:uncharacterized protein (TIGR00730 family)